MTREQHKALDAIAAACGKLDWRSTSEVQQLVRAKLQELEQLRAEKAAAWHGQVRPWVELASELAGIEPDAESGELIPVEHTRTDEDMRNYLREVAARRAQCGAQLDGLICDQPAGHVGAGPGRGGPGYTHEATGPNGVRYWWADDELVAADAGAAAPATEVQPVEWSHYTRGYGGDGWAATWAEYELDVMGTPGDDTSWEWEVRSDEDPFTCHVTGLVFVPTADEDEWERSASEAAAEARQQAEAVARVLAVLARRSGGR